jgi:hypothetical protein
MSDQHLKNIKTLIDLAIARGLFNNGDSVVAIMDSYRHIACALADLEEKRNLSVQGQSTQKKSEMPGFE